MQIYSNANALDLEHGQARTGREVELLIGSRAATKRIRKVGGDVGFAIGADQMPIAIEDSG